MKKLIFGLALALNIASLNAITVYNAEAAPALSRSSAPIASESSTSWKERSKANPYATDYRPRSLTEGTAKNKQQVGSYLTGFNL